MVAQFYEENQQNTLVKKPVFSRVSS